MTLAERTAKLSDLAIDLRVSQSLLEMYQAQGNPDAVEGVKQTIRTLARQMQEHLDEVKAACG